MSYLCNAILIFGPPGVGKGTQGKILNQREEFYHFSSGDLFRSMQKYKTALAEKVNSYMLSNSFVPDELVIALFKENLEREIDFRRLDPDRQYLLLDGIPRTAEQIEPTNHIVNIRQILYLQLEEEEILKQRLLKRGRLEGRFDDQDESKIKKRMVDYKNKTLPSLEKYDSGLIIKIDAAKSIEEVTDSILERIIFP